MRGPSSTNLYAWRASENIYHRDLSQPPYTIANYPPLFPLVQVPFVWLAGPALWYGRVISALSVVLAAVFLGLALHALTKNWLAAVAGGLTLLAFPYILSWSPLNRVDSLALGLSMAGLYVVARWPASRKGRIAAAVLLTASIFTKQSFALAAPLAVFRLAALWPTPPEGLRAGRLGWGIEPGPVPPFHRAVRRRVLHQYRDCQCKRLLLADRPGKRR